jgi:hypothetical protein
MSDSQTPVKAVPVSTADQEGGRLLDPAVYADAPEEQPATD